MCLAVATLVCGMLAGCGSGLAPQRDTPSSPSVKSAAGRRILVLTPLGVGPLEIGMTAGQVAGTGAATSAVGDAEEGWRPGCRVLMYDTEVLGQTPDDTLNGVVSRQHGLEQLSATTRMETPEGIHIGSTLAEVAAAYDRPHLQIGDQVMVRASDATVYRIQLEQTVTSISLELRKTSCTI